MVSGFSKCIHIFILIIFSYVFIPNCKTPASRNTVKQLDPGGVFNQSDSRVSDSDTTNHNALCNSVDVKNRIRNHLRLDLSSSDHELICDAMLKTDHIFGKNFVEEVRKDSGWIGGTEKIQISSRTPDANGAGSTDPIHQPDDPGHMTDSQVETTQNTGTESTPKNESDDSDFDSRFTTENLLKPEVLVAAGIVGSIGVAMTIKGIKEKNKLKPENNPFHTRYAQLLEPYGGKIENVPDSELDDISKKMKEIYLGTDKVKGAYHTKSVDSWRTQAKILDDIDFLHAKNPTRFTLIEFPGVPEYFGGANVKNPDFSQKLPAFSPLIQFEDIGKFNEIGDDLFKVRIADEQSLFEALASRGVLVEREAAHGASVIKWAHKPDSWFRRFVTSNPFMNFMSSILGIKYNRLFTGLSSDQVSRSIAKFSLDMGITPGEAVRAEIGGKRYMRGANYLFGKPHDQFKSHNFYFVRDLTPEARARYLIELTGHEKALSKITGVRSGSRFVASAADARLSINTLGPGNLGQKIQIYGKILSDAAIEKAVGQNDISGYSDKRYGMTVPELFGLEHNGQKLKGDWTPQKSGSISSRFNPDMVRGAQMDLLGALFQDMNSDPGGVTLLKQRLAPADGHNFRFPVDGVPLSNLEAVEFLEERAKKSIPPKSSAELAKYKELIEIFKLQEESLGRSSQSTIDIMGSHRSVSELAVRQTPNVISQNSRKISILKHGNSFSVHVFIDASGVSKVYTDPVSGKTVSAGTKLGNMQFGHDSYTRNEGFTQNELNRSGKGGDFQVSDSYHTRGGLKKLNPGQTDVGSEWGRFSMRGSTVVSLYFSDEYELTDSVKKYQTTMETLRAKGKIPRVPEIRVQAGDVLMQKRPEALLVEILDKTESDSVDHVNDMLEKWRQGTWTYPLEWEELDKRRFDDIARRVYDAKGQEESARLLRKSVAQKNNTIIEIRDMDLKTFSSGNIQVKKSHFETYESVLKFKESVRKRIQDIRTEMRIKKSYDVDKLEEIRKLQKLETDDIITILRKSL